MTGERRFGYRWTVCALLFAATTVNYIDRSTLNTKGCFTACMPIK